MENDSLLPEEEMDKLRREISVLKRKQGTSYERELEDMSGSIAALSKSINSLIRIFKDASEDMRTDVHDTEDLSKKFDKLIERMDKLESQNEKIAKGIVAVANMVEDMQPSSRPRMPQPSRPPQASQPMPSPQPVYSGEPKPLPTYNIPKQEEKKNPFMNFKM